MGSEGYSISKGVKENLNEALISKILKFWAIKKTTMANMELGLDEVDIVTKPKDGVVGIEFPRNNIIFEYEPEEGGLSDLVFEGLLDESGVVRLVIITLDDGDYLFLLEEAEKFINADTLKGLLESKSKRTPGEEVYSPRIVIHTMDKLY